MFRCVQWIFCFCFSFHCSLSSAHVHVLLSSGGGGKCNNSPATRWLNESTDLLLYFCNAVWLFEKQNQNQCSSSSTEWFLPHYEAGLNEQTVHFYVVFSIEERNLLFILQQQEEFWWSREWDWDIWLVQKDLGQLVSVTRSWSGVCLMFSLWSFLCGQGPLIHRRSLCQWMNAQVRLQQHKLPPPSAAERDFFSAFILY